MQTKQMWTFLEVFICGKICFQYDNHQSYFLLSVLNCALLCSSSLAMSAKDKKSEVFIYFNKVKCEFLARSYTVSLNKGILNTSSDLC